MKRVLAAFALLAVVVALSGGALWLQTKATDRLLSACDETAAAWERGGVGACVPEAERLVGLFEKEMRWFPFFLHHAKVEELLRQVSALPLLLTEGDEQSFPAELRRVRTGLTLLLRDERPTPENIL